MDLIRESQQALAFVPPLLRSFTWQPFNQVICFSKFVLMAFWMQEKTEPAVDKRKAGAMKGHLFEEKLHSRCRIGHGSAIYCNDRACFWALLYTNFAYVSIHRLPFRKVFEYPISCIDWILKNATPKPQYFPCLVLTILLDPFGRSNPTPTEAKVQSQIATGQRSTQVLGPDWVNQWDVPVVLCIF